jgi:hypothetical protein
MLLALLIALLALGQHMRQRRRRQLHRVHAHPRRLLQLRHQCRVGAAQPLRVEALFLCGARLRARSSAEHAAGTRS